MFNLPNSLTVLRIVLTPFFLWLFLRGDSYKTAFLLLCLIGLTDFLDGTVARYTGQVTRLGQILDPLADKLFLVSSLIVLIFMDSRLLWPVAIIIGRDILVVAAFFNLYFTGNSEPVKTHVLGKVAAAMQVLVVVGAFISHAWETEIDLSNIPLYLLWCAVMLSVFSGALYAFKSLDLIPDRTGIVPVPTASRDKPKRDKRYTKEELKCHRSA